MSPLTSEQIARIEENRRKALEKRALRAKIEANRQRALEIQAARKKVGEQIVPLTAFKIQSPKSESSNPTCSSGKYQPLNVSFTSSLTPKCKRNDNDTFQKQIACAAPKSVLTGHCQLISTDIFVVNTGFHRVMIEIFKTIKSASYDSSRKIWRFHIKDHDKLLQELAVLKTEVSISGLPRKILDMFTKPRVDFKSMNVDLTKIDSHLLSRVMPFQREGIMFGISRNGRCLIADDMGLGKTIQALGIAHYYQQDWPVLIVCPTSVKFQWMEAIHNWLPSVPAHKICAMTSGKDFDCSVKILITSYNLISRYSSILCKTSYGVIIVDESHFMKNYSSARSKAVCAILKTSKRVVLLSGTPALSRPVELFTQLNAIDPKTFSHFREYGIRYCAGKLSNLGFWDYSGCSNMEELHLVLKHSVMIRRLKSDVLLQLPSKIRQMVLLNPGEICRNKDVKVFEKALQSKSLKGMERRGTLLQYYAYSGKCKIPSIVDYVNDQLESGRKFIIFAHHKVVLDSICDAIIKQKVDYIRIDGNTSSLRRKEMCDQFQQSGKCHVAVLSITAANSGLTLTAAQLVIFAELFWNPGILTQAEDRAHRIGQRDCVLVQYLVSPGTADDHLWPLIQAKLEVLNKAGLSKDSFQTCDTSSVTYESSTQKTIKDFFNSLDDDFTLLELLNSVDV